MPSSNPFLNIINFKVDRDMKKLQKKAEQEAEKRKRRAREEKQRTQLSKKNGQLGNFLKF